VPKLYDEENGPDPKGLFTVPVVVTVSVKGEPPEDWEVTVYEMVPVTVTVVGKLAPKSQVTP
jgi:hypothetical protein